MLLRAALVATFTFAAGITGVTAVSARTSASHMNPNAWVIGPVINGRSYSRGMPLHPSPGPDRAWHVEVPGPGGSLNAVTFRHGSLAGKSRIVLRYRVEAAPGVRIMPRTGPTSPPWITLYFQRSGDNWSARGPFEAYRWYATFATQTITPGEHQMVVPLTGNWTAVEVSTARTNPAKFADAVAGADQVGFVLGGGEGYGKGVFASGPARLVVTDFRVE